MLDSQIRANKAYRAKTLLSRKHFCEDCNKSFRDKYTLVNHMNSRIHKPKIEKSYHCKHCNYQTRLPSNFKKHLKTKKHLKKAMANALIKTPKKE